jgi:hypothetical protein
MTHLPVGNIVRFQVNGKKAFGTVRTEATPTATGPVVSIELLPDFRHLLPTGWTDANVADLAVVRICECAKLGYIAQWGDEKGQLFTTGCDFSRQPGRTGKFLPGHDAKAKGFLVRAFFQGPLLDGRSGLAAARDLGDKIAAKVAEGIDKESQRIAEGARSKRQRTIKTERPAVREDNLTDAQRLAQQHKVTDPMMHALAAALTRWDGAILGATPAGTALAMKTRRLTSWGHVTTLGRQVMDYAPLEADKVVCTDNEGSYTEHAWKSTDEGWECRRCSETTEDL